jgi:hypothetical protein
VPYWLSFEIGQPMGLTQSDFAGETELWKSSRNRVSEVLYSQLREDIRISVSNLTEREGHLPDSIANCRTSGTVRALCLGPFFERICSTESPCS